VDVRDEPSDDDGSGSWVGRKMLLQKTSDKP
jgi:hypothetical protein